MTLDPFKNSKSHQSPAVKHFKSGSLKLGVQFKGMRSASAGKSQWSKYQPQLSVWIDGIALDPAVPIKRDIIKEYGLIKCILI